MATDYLLARSARPTGATGASSATFFAPRLALTGASFSTSTWTVPRAATLPRPFVAGALTGAAMTSSLGGSRTARLPRLARVGAGVGVAAST
jgi:hypothetical protein